jgi:hypothetical protein
VSEFLFAHGRTAKEFTANLCQEKARWRNNRSSSKKAVESYKEAVGGTKKEKYLTSLAFGDF